MGNDRMPGYDNLHRTQTQINRRNEAMWDCFKNIDGKKTGIFAAGVLFGTAGIKLLSSKDAKKVYTNCTAAVLRAKDCVMKTATTIRGSAEDIYADAVAINEERAAAKKEAFEDAEACFEDEAEESNRRDCS